MSYIEDILKKLGWDDGFQMPVANAENQELEQELAKLTLQKNKSKNNFDNVVNRLSNLKEHFKYVIQEKDQTQKLITAHKQQYDTELNQYHVLKGEKSKLDYDNSETKKRIHFLEERRENQGKDLEKAVIKVDRIKQETGWDIEALKAWEESLKKRDDDNEMLKKWSKEDERKFNQLEAKRLFLQTDFDAKTATIGTMVCELHSSKMIIERTGKAIKQQMNQREALIKQWKETVYMLQQRDNEILACQERILESRKLKEKQKERLQEENAMLDNEKRNNREIEMELERLNAMHSRMRRELDNLQQNLFLTISECQTEKRRVASTANALEKVRAISRNMDWELSNKEKNLIKTEEDLENIQKKIEEMKEGNVSASARITKIQSMIEMEEKYCNMLKDDTKKINNNLYRTDSVFTEQQAIGKNLETSINNAYCMCNKLRKHIRDEKKALEKWKEIVYDMQFKIDEFEQRLCKLSGSNKQEEHMDEKDEKIKQLEKAHADHTEVQHTLQNQVDRLQDEMRKLSNFIAADREELETLQNKVENHMLVFDIGRKQIAIAKKSTQEKQVEENIMRLRINHIEEDMKKEEQRIFNLQKIRLTLDQAMKEHNLEIEMKKSIIICKKKSLEEEKGRLKGDIALRKVKLDQVQKKYHIELMSLGKDEDGQPLSVAHYKIRYAQDKFMLQVQGDELDQQIKVAEKEIMAMENTLKMVNLTNVAFKNNLSTLKDDDPEVTEAKALEELLSQWSFKSRKARKDLAAITEKVEELKDQLENKVNVEKAKKKEIITKLEEENVLIENQERSKEEKLKRTKTQLIKLLRKLTQNLPELILYDQDIEIRQLKEANNSVQKLLDTMRNERPELAPNINKYLEEQNLELRTSSCSSLRTSSWTSSSNNSMQSSSRSLDLEMIPVTIKKVDIAFG